MARGQLHRAQGAPRPTGSAQDLLRTCKEGELMGWALGPWDGAWDPSPAPTGSLSMAAPQHELTHRQANKEIRFPRHRPDAQPVRQTQ